jgi:hypothetical protein
MGTGIYDIGVKNANMLLTTCCYLVSKLRKSVAEKNCPTYIHVVQKDKVKCMFKLDIEAEIHLIPLCPLLCPLLCPSVMQTSKCRQVLVKSLSSSVAKRF